MTDDILARADAYQRAKRTVESKALVRDLAAEVRRLRAAVELQRDQTATGFNGYFEQRERAERAEAECKVRQEVALKNVAIAERAEARVAELEGALRRIARSPCANPKCPCCTEDGEWARAALAEDTPPARFPVRTPPIPNCICTNAWVGGHTTECEEHRAALAAGGSPQVAMIGDVATMRPAPPPARHVCRLCDADATGVFKISETTSESRCSEHSPAPTGDALTVPAPVPACTCAGPEYQEYWGHAPDCPERGNP